MVAALVRWQFDLDGSDVFTDAPAERVIGGAGLREGRNVAQLGGPIIPSQCSALQLVLNNHDGYYTFGAGMTLGPGSKVRLQWKAVAADAWVTRFVGSLSELVTGTDANPIMITRWVGALYRFTSGNIPGRLIINQTPQSIMTVLSDAAGIPVADRDFDRNATLYNRQLSPGYAGVQEVQTMVGGFIYDAPDGKVRLELPPTRAGKAVVARYTDGDPTAAELGVPPPRRLTRPFGIINHVDGEYHYYTPISSTASSATITFPTQTVNENVDAINRTRTAPLGFTPSGNVSVSGYTIEMTIFRLGAINTAIGRDTLTLSSPATSLDESVTIELVDGEMVVVQVEITNLAIVILGDTICVQWTATFTPAAPRQGLTSLVRYRITVTVADTVSFEQTIAVFPRASDDGDSIERYGYRPRSTPLVIGIYQATPLADDFVPDYAELDAAMQADLDAYATPIPVFAVERACDTADHRADILARRLSDKVHLTADGPSMLGADLDAFVEAIQTNLAPTGEITQTLWIESTGAPPEPPPPITQLSAPTGLALTTSGGDITANWNAVTDATGYTVEWREQGSGDAWQTANVSAPPHTFTP